MSNLCQLQVTKQIRTSLLRKRASVVFELLHMDTVTIDKPSMYKK